MQDAPSMSTAGIIIIIFCLRRELQQFVKGHCGWWSENLTHNLIGGMQLQHH